MLTKQYYRINLEYCCLFSIVNKTEKVKNILLGICILLVLSVLNESRCYAGVTIENCQIFPADNIWNVRIDQLPLDPNSNEYIEVIGRDSNVHPDFGSGTWNGEPIGIPFNVVESTQQLVTVNFTYGDESDPGPYPIPSGAKIQGGDNSSGDRHVLILEKDSCKLYEMYKAYPQADGSWNAGSGAIFDLNSQQLRTLYWTSADAAGLPILPGLVRYEEAVSGTISHAIRFTAPQTRRSFVWPARHFASNITDYRYPPMGQRFRLKQSVDISGYSPMVRTILVAMKLYGIILADNGSSWDIGGVPDERWDNDVLHELVNIKGYDFEAVDVSSLMKDPDSGEVNVSQPPRTENISIFFNLLF